jgi:ribosomal-protein-alanine N-acetyltransferase
MDSFPTLRTSRLELREVALDDSQDIFSIYSCSEVVRFYDRDAYASIEQARGQIQSWAANCSKDVAVRWGISELGNAKIIGTCGFNFWNKQYSSSPLGYDLLPSYWNKGIITEAVKEILRFGFEEMKLNRVQAITFPENVPSIRVLEKLGFQNEGTLREWGFLKGRFQDVYCYSLLRREWKV